jgi:predicted kinase
MLGLLLRIALSYIRLIQQICKGGCFPVAREIVLVNGFPGSGKTTVGALLATHMCAPFLSKDRVKEALADALDCPELRATLGMTAMETIWSLAAHVRERVIIDSWWFRPRDFEHAISGLRKCGASSVVEVWCDVPIALAQDRYRQRIRHDVHQDTREMLKEWAQWESEGRPLGIGPVIRLDSRGPVDAGVISDYAAMIRDVLNSADASMALSNLVGLKQVRVIKVNGADLENAVVNADAVHALPRDRAVHRAHPAGKRLGRWRMRCA